MDKLIPIENYRPESANPFEKAMLMTYDNRPALTDGYLLFTEPTELPEWDFAPLESKMKDRPQPAFEGFSMETEPFAVSKGYVYFTGGHAVQQKYFDAVLSIYPDVEWATQRNFIGILQATSNGQTKALLMPIRGAEYSAEIEAQLSHLVQTWYWVDNAYSKIESAESLLSPQWKAVTSHKDLVERLSQDETSCDTRIDRLKAQIAEEKTEKSRIIALRKSIQQTLVQAA